MIPKKNKIIKKTNKTVPKNKRKKVETTFLLAKKDL